MKSAKDVMRRRTKIIVRGKKQQQQQQQQHVAGCTFVQDTRSYMYLKSGIRIHLCCFTIFQSKKELKTSLKIKDKFPPNPDTVCFETTGDLQVHLFTLGIIQRSSKSYLNVIIPIFWSRPQDHYAEFTEAVIASLWTGAVINLANQSFEQDQWCL